MLITMTNYWLMSVPSYVAVCPSAVWLNQLVYKSQETIINHGTSTMFLAIFVWSNPMTNTSKTMLPNEVEAGVTCVGAWGESFGSTLQPY